MARRSRAREVALQLLFQRDLNPTAVPRAAIEQFVHDRLLGDSDLKTYCLSLYDGTLSHQIEIDQKLTQTATNWRLTRMLPIDRNVLRLASYELLFDTTPQPFEVVIHEANELACRYGSIESPKFVNGILDKIAKTRIAILPSSSGKGVGGEGLTSTAPTTNTPSPPAPLSEVDKQDGTTPSGQS